METRNFCQSCSMPLDNPGLLGTEEDNSPSFEFCKYWYQNGEFTSPGLTLDEMKDRITRMMDKETVPDDVWEAAINRLPRLKRWKTETAPSACQVSK